MCDVCLVSVVAVAIAPGNQQRPHLTCIMQQHKMLTCAKHVVSQARVDHAETFTSS